MERILKWLLPALVLTEVALVRFDVIDLGAAIAAVVVLEILLLVVGGRQVLVAIRRFRKGRTAGLDVWAALESGLAVFLPRPIARVVALEPRVWVYLALWLSRCRRPGSDDFSYHRRSLVGPLLLVVVFTTPVEVLLFELLIPWQWLRVVLLVAAAYAVVWMFGFYGSLVVLPHRLASDGLHVHYGLLARALIPYEQIVGLELIRKPAPSFGEGLKISPAQSAAYLGIAGRTDLTIRLREPRPIEGFLRSTVPVRILHLAADEPPRLAAALARRLDP